MQVDVADPRWLPVDYAADSDVFRFLHIDLDVLEKSAFLDSRMAAAWDSAIEVPAQAVSQASVLSPALLFHTAFCGSTLLARALQCPPRAVSLREPVALLSLSSALIHSQSDRQRALIEERLRSAMSLLSRPWTEGGRVLIKPTNQANNLIGPILRAYPASRAVLLYSSLKDFMLSCFKKLPDAETKIRWMAQHLLVGTRLSSNLGIRPFSPFNLIESCALTWFAQIEYFAAALAVDSNDNLRTLDMKTLLAEPDRAVGASANWLGLHAVLEDMEARNLAVFSRHSKAPGQDFGAATRETANDMAYARYGDLIERGLEWARHEILPAATLPLDWKPLSI